MLDIDFSKAGFDRASAVPAGFGSSVQPESFTSFSVATSRSTADSYLPPIEIVNIVSMVGNVASRGDLPVIVSGARQTASLIPPVRGDGVPPNNPGANPSGQPRGGQRGGGETVAPPGLPNPMPRSDGQPGGDGGRATPTGLPSPMPRPGGQPGGNGGRMTPPGLPNPMPRPGGQPGGDAGRVTPPGLPNPMPRPDVQPGADGGRVTPPGLPNPMPRPDGQPGADGGRSTPPGLPNPMPRPDGQPGADGGRSTPPGLPNPMPRPDGQPGGDAGRVTPPGLPNPMPRPGGQRGGDAGRVTPPGLPNPMPRPGGQPGADAGRVTPPGLPNPMPRSDGQPRGGVPGLTPFTPAQPVEIAPLPRPVMPGGDQAPRRPETAWRCPEARQRAMLVLLKQGDLRDFVKELMELSPEKRSDAVKALSKELESRGISLELFGENKGLQMNLRFGDDPASKSLVYDLTTGDLVGGHETIHNGRYSYSKESGFEGLREVAEHVRKALRDTSTEVRPTDLFKQGWLEELRDSLRGATDDKVRQAVSDIQKTLEGKGVKLEFDSSSRAFILSYTDTYGDKTVDSKLVIPLNGDAFRASVRQEFKDGSPGYTLDNMSVKAIRRGLDVKLAELFGKSM
ncbi:MAG: hypothetical protein K2X93_06260 [Candidatus Obscuribacterales bacterium]|nr:hypothetical protein [Candidatus Obscuribacterales bacterium]